MVVLIGGGELITSIFFLSFFQPILPYYYDSLFLRFISD